MMTILRCAFAVAVMALGAQQALAQPVTGCPAGHAMQSSDPSGRKVTCVPVTAAAETDIIGTWAVTGTTTCLQSTSGFNPTFMSPVIPTAGNTAVSQLSGTFLGTRTFHAGGTGRSVGTSHTMVFPATVLGPQPPISIPAGGASVATLDATFTWSVQLDGTLVIDDDNSIAQPFTAPPSLLGQSATVENVPSFVGYVSKDKRTIMLTHPGMSIETSVRRNASGVEQSRTQRFCARSRVLTRLPN
jgi:hypothetical protein